jgi:hypothetical protein
MQDFIANVLELLGLAYFQEFSNTMYDESMYTIPFVFTFSLPLFTLFLFYRVFDSVKGANAGRWMVWALGTTLICAVTNFFYVNNRDTKLSLDFAFSDITAFVLVTAFYSFVTYFILSFFIRLLSTHRRFVPFRKF